MEEHEKLSTASELENGSQNAAPCSTEGYRPVNKENHVQTNEESKHERSALKLENFLTTVAPIVRHRLKEVRSCHICGY